MLELMNAVAAATGGVRRHPQRGGGGYGTHSGRCGAGRTVTVTFSMAKAGHYSWARGRLRPERSGCPRHRHPGGLGGGETFAHPCHRRGLVRMRRPAPPVRRTATKETSAGCWWWAVPARVHRRAGVVPPGRAVRSGAGLVSLAVPETIWPIVAAKLQRGHATIPCPPGKDGRLCSEEAWDLLLGGAGGRRSRPSSAPDWAGIRRLERPR